LALVVLGLSLDLLWGAPLGLWALCLLAAYSVIFLSRGILSGQEFWVLWAWYAFACALAVCFGLILMSMRATHMPSLTGAALQWVVSAALFPFAWRLIERFEDADMRFR
jgi:rod shape-determining protein MreD